MLVLTATGGVPLTLNGGSMQGTIDARDGALATLQNGVNTLASTLITQVNAIYTNGYSTSGATGATFFTGTNASDIAVNAALASNPGLMQSSGSATASGDNSVALALAQMSSTAQIALNGQTFDGAYEGTVASLGDAVQTANNNVSNQTTVMNMLNTQRSSISGVSVDQEMTNLMSYQRAYEASAELVSTINTLMGDTMAMKTS
jgi:flagellar hook-associated protein 1 FlgK